MNVPLSYDDLKVIRCALWFVIEANRLGEMNANVEDHEHLFLELKHYQAAMRCANNCDSGTAVGDRCSACYQRERRARRAAE